VKGSAPAEISGEGVQPRRAIAQQDPAEQMIGGVGEVFIESGMEPVPEGGGPADRMKRRRSTQEMATSFRDKDPCGGPADAAARVDRHQGAPNRDLIAPGERLLGIFSKNANPIARAKGLGPRGLDPPYPKEKGVPVRSTNGIPHHATD
jgi:hypothetical protein